MVERARAFSPDALLYADLRWVSVPLREVVDNSWRLEAGVYATEGRYARKVLEQCKWPLKPICGEKGFADAYHRPRFKRIWVQKSEFPIFQPSQVAEINPKPSGYLSSLTKTDIDALRVRKGQILLTCSGTIGNSTIVSDTLDQAIFSHDIIRITCKEKADTGYLYAFLRSKTGQALLKTSEYGAVISHIEPHHLEKIHIPDPPAELKRQIHDLVMESFALRDDSNALLDEALSLLKDALNLPPIEQIKPRYFDPNAGVRNYTVKLSQVNGRLDASYHVPVVDQILQHLHKKATTTHLESLVTRIFIPGRFTRIYVQEGQGAVYFTGKHILELDPSDKKYLSFSRHSRKIRDELTIRENMLLMTCSGTIGKVVLCPKHWDGWVMTHDIIRIVPKDNLNTAGYLWIFLLSEYGQLLIKRNSYGAVVPHIEAHHITQVPIPILKDNTIQEKINRLALKANEKRAKSYYAEQKAIRMAEATARTPQTSARA